MMFNSLYRPGLHPFLSLLVFFNVATGTLLHLFSTCAQASVSSTTDNCIQQLLQDAPETMTIGEVKAYCNATSHAAATEQPAPGEEVGVVEKRLISDDKNLLKPFSLMAHNSNYLLMGAYNFQDWDSTQYQESEGNDLSFDDTEIQFQLSIKTPLAVDIFDKNLDIFAAYTVRSFWQAYNSDISSPFRETNHQPEMWLQTQHNWELFGIRNTVNIFGIAHQSNGQSGDLSRSWNRVYAGILLERENLALLFKPWMRISESQASDDNPDIEDYLGHGEVHLAYKNNNHVFTLMSRNNLESGFSKGAIELGWSFPLFHYDYIKGYIQYFSGYGESLIDYNNSVNRIGFGVLLTDIL